MVLRRFAEAIDRRPQGYRARRAILNIAANDFLRLLKAKRGASGGEGVSGWDLSNVAHAAFWSTLLISQRRKKFTMTLLGQVYQDTAAVAPYVEEKRTAAEILRATEGIDADSLVGFVNVAVMQFRPDGASGAPLVPREEAHKILRAVLLRGAMVGELASAMAQEAWLGSHPEGKRSNPERHWKQAQGKAETLYQSWRADRKKLPKRLV